ncbi:ParB/RepB/Spo0J family partition protein [Bifidobacterium sp. W8108]|uniref:ParB/RepB/Spo0J family partition protein n=1 Tax=unclassified Bifidobacterium TaxID=2608897 RepID=UPI0018DEB08F|nr:MULTISPECIES: ParB/RepB/Spo0J family partition protein [unclassified Bifidobacterium]MBH9979468.1 ParB/RepB/Spo0J family partition protein [Bifidobacterium sp. W8108]MBI0174170.1 ParB/RepB/Spo0J family partition protein [Bifidobacterium sp. M0307]
MSTKKTPAKAKTVTKAVDGPALIQVAASDITPNPDNPRRNLGDLTELAASIASQGIQQPLVVTPADGQGKHMLIMGHRRHAASVKAGLNTLPCIVRQADTRQQAELMLTENIQRNGLTPMEEARGYARLLDLGETEDAMAKATGRSRATVRRRLKVAAIRPDLIPAGQTSFDQLEQIAAYGDRPDLQAKLSRAAGTNNWDYTLDQCREQVKHAAWFGQVRDTARELGWETVNGLPSAYRTPSGYERIWRLSPGEDLRNCLANLGVEERVRVTTLAVADSGESYNRGAILLHRPTEEEIAERERENAERSERENRRRAEQAQASRARSEYIARRAGFARRATRLVSDHLERIVKRATPLPKSRDILAAAVLHTDIYGYSVGVSMSDPMLNDPWGTGNRLTEPDDRHRVQAAIYTLLKGMTLDHLPSTWGSENQHCLPMLRDYYAILAMTGYQASDEEQQALDGSMKDETQQTPQE